MTKSHPLFTAQNSSYKSVLQAYIKNLQFNASTTPKPIIIVTPLQESLVTGTVLCAKGMGVQHKIRSGGHDYDGISYVSDEKFIILDIFNLWLIDVNIEKELHGFKQLPLLENFTLEFGKRVQYMDSLPGFAQLLELVAT